jgi:hypothetical protein
MSGHFEGRKRPLDGGLFSDGFILALFGPLAQTGLNQTLPCEARMKGVTRLRDCHH